MFLGGDEGRCFALQNDILRQYLYFCTIQAINCLPGSRRRFWAQDLCISAHLEARFEIDGRSSRPLRVCCQKPGDRSKQNDEVEIEVEIEIEIEPQYR